MNDQAVRGGDTAPEEGRGPPAASAGHRALHNTTLRWVSSFVLAFVLVAILANAAKSLVESTTTYRYTIHWLETVPFLVLVAGISVERWLRAQVRQIVRP